MLCDRCKGVEAEDQTLACGVLKGGPCTPCKERATIRQEIRQLEAEIMKLKAKHDALATTMNAFHDSFIHKLPPEIGSRIFRFSLPTFNINNSGYHQWEFSRFEGPLRLGAVCRKWRQLAWATPNLWETLQIYITPSTTPFLAQSLPGLLREWLSRSGVLPLTIRFHHYGCSESDSDNPPSEDQFSDDSASDAPTPDSTIDLVARSIIEILNLHSGRWRAAKPPSHHMR